MEKQEFRGCHQRLTLRSPSVRDGFIGTPTNMPNMGPWGSQTRPARLTLGFHREGGLSVIRDCDADNIRDRL